MRKIVTIKICFDGVIENDRPADIRWGFSYDFHDGQQPEMLTQFHSYEGVIQCMNRLAILGMPVDDAMATIAIAMYCDSGEVHSSIWIDLNEVARDIAQRTCESAEGNWFNHVFFDKVEAPETVLLHHASTILEEELARDEEDWELRKQQTRPEPLAVSFDRLVDETIVDMIRPTASNGGAESEKVVDELAPKVGDDC